MTDSAVTIVWKANYEPFGKATVTVNTVENNLRSIGQYYDRETGMHYNYFRDYDPSTGRYPQADPIGLAGGMNLYAYVGGNPISRIDPLGLDATVALYPGASGFGHIGIGINSPNTTGFYPAPGSSTFDVVTGQPVPGIEKADSRTPSATITIRTTPAQDEAIQDFINTRKRNPGKYDLNDRNCATTVRDALGSGGINTPATIYPRNLMRNLQNQYGRH